MNRPSKGKGDRIKKAMMAWMDGEIRRQHRTNIKHRGSAMDEGKNE